MNQLSKYMNGVIQSVNQHAKVIDTLTFELDKKLSKKEIAEMFNLLSNGYPYEKVITKSGGDPL